MCCVNVGKSSHLLGPPVLYMWNRWLDQMNEWMNEWDTFLFWDMGQTPCHPSQIHIFIRWFLPGCSNFSFLPSYLHSHCTDVIRPLVISHLDSYSAPNKSVSFHSLYSSMHALTWKALSIFYVSGIVPVPGSSCSVYLSGSQPSFSGGQMKLALYLREVTEKLVNKYIWHFLGGSGKCYQEK